MSQNNDQQAFFVDDELIERLLRGDAPVANKPTRPASTNALADAIQLATNGRLDEAAAALEDAAKRGEDPAEVYSALGHVRFEQQRWEDAAAAYAKVTTLDVKHPSARYNRG
jgi:Flp pilus assembly protein TadD